MRRLLWTLPLLGAVAIAAAASGHGPSQTRAAVVGTRDATTILVRVGRRVRPVRIAGVAAPTGRDCHAAASLKRLRALTLHRRVTLLAAGARSYVTLPGGEDLGRVLIAEGTAHVDAWGPTFTRLPDYVEAEQLAQAKPLGIWRACAADVSVTATPEHDVVTTGSTIKFSLAVTNAGPLAAPGVSVDVRQPAGSTLVTVDLPGATCASSGWHAVCTLASLAAGARVNGSAVVTAPNPGVLALNVNEKYAWCVRAPCGATPLADPKRQNDIAGAFVGVGGAGTAPPVLCAPSYPTVCIPPPPPRLTCTDIPFKNFQVPRGVPNPDPQHLDNNEDGVGCTFDDY